MNVEDFLAHHGIKGQRKGVKHGPPYPLDKEDSAKIKKGEKVSTKNDDEPKYNSGTKKYKIEDARHLTDEELKKRVNRLTQENNYREQLKKSQEAAMTKRQKLVQKIFVDSAAQAASNVMATVYTNAAKNFIGTKFPALIGQTPKADNSNSESKKKNEESKQRNKENKNG